MSAEKVLRQVGEVKQLLDAATPPPWDPARRVTDPTGVWIQGHKVGTLDQAIADANLIVAAVNNLEALIELKRAAAEWAFALHEIHKETFTGPGPHPALERFQDREHRLAELALKVLEV